MGNRRRVCIIGGGISGICAGARLAKELPQYDYCIFDENSNFGGTWLLQKYPNCECDTPSHLYSFSFAQNPDWSSLFCKRDEILAYLQSVAKKYGLYANVKFNHVVEVLKWDSEKNVWLVQRRNKINGHLTQEEFDFIIAGPGPFRRPNYPEVCKKFTGPILHSADWPKDVSLENKIVGVIGSGATAVQIIPGIVQSVKKLYSFQRYGGHNLSGTWLSKRHLKTHIQDENLMNQLLPDYPFGLRRVCLTNDYYPALRNSKKVEIIRSEITGMEGGCIHLRNGKRVDVDILILATGFEQLGQRWFHPCRIFSNGGNENTQVDLLSEFRSHPKSYLGIMPEKMPNLFLLWGPNTAASNNSSILVIEAQMEWILTVLKKMEDCMWNTITARKEAVDEYMEILHKNMENYVFGSNPNLEGDKPWAIDGRSGRNTAQFPGGYLSYWINVRRVKWRDLSVN